MNHRSILAILISATALTLFPSLPRANAQETLTLWYYQPSTGGATRQPRPVNGGHFVSFLGPASLSCGTTISGHTANVGMSCVPGTWIPNNSSNTQYVLVYLSITGGAGGDVTVFPNAQDQLPASLPLELPNIPNPQIGVNAYYFVTGGSACPAGQSCGSAAIIDEFGELQGALLDDTFVTVNVPSDTALNAGYTLSGNKYGEVNTTQYAVQINADQPTFAYPSTNPPTPTTEIFDRWVTASGGKINSSNAKELNVGAQTDDFALALYHPPCSSGSTWSSTPIVSQCIPPPTCPSGEVWNATKKQCVITPNPGGICHMHCPLGSECVVVDYECDCAVCRNPISGQTGPPTVQ